MVVKFLSLQHTGEAQERYKYLLSGKRVKNGTAKRVLQGDPNITKDLILNNPHKQKVDVGCLSFEEANIDERIKYKHAKFEEMLLP